MDTMQLEALGETATWSAGEALAPLLRPGDVLLLSGDLGAGKTQLVKGIASGLGIAEPVTSPTFNILLVHHGRLPLYHVDLYRLDRADQLEDIDFFGTLEAGGVTAVEWGDRFREVVDAGTVRITIHIESDTKRILEVIGSDRRGRELVSDWSRACDGIIDLVVRGDGSL